MDAVMALADKYKLVVMQDCAQSYGSLYKGKACGTKAHLAAFSFHETKNYNAGEGGALVVNVPEWEERAHFLQEKGTDRRLVLNGVKNKYSWVDKGSSYLLSNILAALLYGQLEEEEYIKSKRALITKAYQELFKPFHEKGLLQMMDFPANCEVNHHAFWVIFNQQTQAVDFMAKLREQGVSAYIGYIPLHSSPMGKKLGYAQIDLPITEDVGNRIVRMPFYTELAENGLDHCIGAMQKVLNEILN
jgi:dTDP-4-amino-4,6-dideoxygalactose transaminase